MLNLCLLMSVALCSAPPDPPVMDGSDAFFNGPVIPVIRVQVEASELAKLKATPRTYIQASIQENGRTTHDQVALKLKGAAGSFRDWDDRPALTLNMRKFSKGRTFHGLVKFHLNNSVQDESYLNELLCSEMFRKAGIPAPRVTHARLWLNGRDLGLYVLKEGFDKAFLKRSFPDPTGNLYDGGFCQDINADLEKDEGTGPDDRSDLKAIVEAAADPDLAKRVARLEKLVNMDAFITFMAVERMTCHWDGYTDKANNYRIYFKPKGKAVFLPHGMDQMFSDPEAGLFNSSGSIVAAVVFQDEALKKRYHDRLNKLVTLLFSAGPLAKRVDQIEARLRPMLESINHDLAVRQGQLAEELKGRIVARAASLRKQLGKPPERR